MTDMTDKKNAAADPLHSPSPAAELDPPRRSAVVLVFDRLQPAFLGPYGGTACETPACNRLAADGYVAEQCYADAAELEVVYRSFWSGQHAVQHAMPQAAHNAAPHAADDAAPEAADEAAPQAVYDAAPEAAHDATASVPRHSSQADSSGETAPAGRSLAERLEAAGIHTELLADDPRIASHRWSEGFGQRLAIDHGGPPATADTAGAMRVAQVLAAAAERWEQADRDTLLWMHAAAWDDAWDAPYEFRQQGADPEDPPPPEFAAPPCRSSDGPIDPDELLGYVQAYVGQVAAWDACLEAFLEAFAASPLAEHTLLIVTAPRGFPLGEHGRVGDAPPALYNELLQLPLFIRLPQGACPLVRDQGLVQPADLFATLLDWFEVAHNPAEPRLAPPVEANSATTTSAASAATTSAIDDDVEPTVEDASRFAQVTGWGRSLLPRVQALPDAGRRLAAAIAPGQLAVRTPHWLLRISNHRRSDPPTDDKLELYVKPDDRWEANEVSSRCVAEVQTLRTLAATISLRR